MSEYGDYLDELRSEVEKKAKRANQRLRQLEIAGIGESSRAYQVTARKVYDHLPGYTQTKAGNIAFDRSVKSKTIQELEEELIELDRFLNAEEIHTSTVRGYKKSLEASYKGYKESQKDETLTFEQYLQMFGEEKNRQFGYMNVRAMQKVPGATSKIVQREIDKAVKKQSKTKQVLGVANYTASVKKAVEGKKQKSKSKRSGKRKK